MILYLYFALRTNPAYMFLLVKEHQLWEVICRHFFRDILLSFLYIDSTLYNYIVLVTLDNFFWDVVKYNLW